MLEGFSSTGCVVFPWRIQIPRSEPNSRLTWIQLPSSESLDQAFYNSHQMDAKGHDLRRGYTGFYPDQTR